MHAITEINLKHIPIYFYLNMNELFCGYMEINKVSIYIPFDAKCKLTH